MSGLFIRRILLLVLARINDLERDRGTEGETSYFEALIGEEEHTKKRKGIEAQRVKPPTLRLS